MVSCDVVRAAALATQESSLNDIITVVVTLAVIAGLWLALRIGRKKG